MNDLTTINYKKWKAVDKEYEIEIEELHHCFLQGSSEDSDIIEYLGIWTTDKELKICDIKNDDSIRIKSYSYKNIYTHSCIKRFLEEHELVEKISEEEFMCELNNMLERIK